MKIIGIQEKTVPISSEIQNAYINFKKMDCSVVAIKTDIKKDGKFITGYGFHSNGRYAVSERSTAVGAIDMAIWDIVSKIENLPLYEYLAKKYGDGTFKNKIFVYAAGG